MTDADPDVVEAAPAPRPERREADRRAARMALGVSAVFLLGMYLAWPMSFLGAIFTGLLLQAPQPVPGRAAGAVLSIAVFAMAANWIGAQYLLHYPALFAIALVLAMFALFRYGARGGSPIIVILVTIAVLMQPIVLRTSPDLALIVATWLPVNLAIGLFASWAVFDLIPPGAEAGKAKPPAAEVDPERSAVRMTLIAAPFALVFFSLDWGAALTLVFVAILTQQLSAVTEAAARATKGILLANLAGGLVAMLAYELIVMAPTYPFMALLAAGLIAIHARLITSDAPWAPLAGTALNAMLVLLGGAMAPLDTSVEAQLSDRLIQIGAAVAYILVAFNIVDHFLPNRPRPEVEPEPER